MSQQRVGIGYDVHRLEAGRKLVLGGVEVPHHFGLAGHSDADVLLHAIIDALLGATAKGDIGSWFPDTDPQFKNADSKILLEKVIEVLLADGWSVVNCDASIIAEKPKLREYIDSMRVTIAQLMKVEQLVVSVKATTHERIGALGREEGIAAQAVVLLEKK